MHREELLQFIEHLEVDWNHELGGNADQVLEIILRHLIQRMVHDSTTADAFQRLIDSERLGS